MDLKSMSLDRLAKLRDQVNSDLVAKVGHERRTLESEPSKISRFQIGGAPASGRSARAKSFPFVSRFTFEARRVR
jgi:hypothetical protein